MKRLRTVWRVLALDADYEATAPEGTPDRWPVSSARAADVEASVGSNGMHYPCIDIDGIRVELRDSSTPGNCHLLIDHPVTWDAYERLLLALKECGIVQAGYVDASIARQHTAVRLRLDKDPKAPFIPKPGWAIVEPGQRLRCSPGSFDPPAPDKKTEEF